MRDEDAFFGFVEDLQFEWWADTMMRAHLIIGLTLSVAAPEVSHGAALMVIALEEVQTS